MCTALHWIGAHLDRILAFVAILIAVVAMLDVRQLFRELRRRDEETENRVRLGVLKELLTHTSSFASFSRAAQFIDFYPNQPDKQAAIAMLMSFRLQQLVSPDATPQQLSQLRQSTRNQIEQTAKEYARTIIESGTGKLKEGWQLD